MTTATVVNMTINSWYVTLIPKILTWSPGKNSVSTRACPGSHRVCARPMSASNTPSVMTSVTSVGAPCSRRMSCSISRPMIGATTNSTASAAGSCGHPCSTVSSQYVNAAIMPTAPCAKLKMPDVMYVTVRPVAVNA